MYTDTGRRVSNRGAKKAPSGQNGAFLSVNRGVVNIKKPRQIALAFLFGAGNEARTRYLHLGKVALYQMSYARREQK